MKFSRRFYAIGVRKHYNIFIHDKDYFAGALPSIVYIALIGLKNSNWLTYIVLKHYIPDYTKQK